MQTRLYYATTDIIKSPADLDRLYRKASPGRQQKVDRIRREDDKRLSLLAEYLMITALKNEGIGEISLTCGEKGKPYLTDKSLFFNLSHSGKVCICAVSDKDLGCDVEKIKRAKMNIANRFFSKEECLFLESTPESERDNAFFRLWTMKESFIKAVGTGLSMPLNSFSIDLSSPTPRLSYSTDGRSFFLKEYKLLNGYCFAVCGLDGDFAEATEILSVE